MSMTCRAPSTDDDESRPRPGSWRRNAAVRLEAVAAWFRSVGAWLHEVAAQLLGRPLLRVAGLLDAAPSRFRTRLGMRSANQTLVQPPRKRAVALQGIADRILDSKRRRHTVVLAYLLALIGGALLLTIDRSTRRCARCIHQACQGAGASALTRRPGPGAGAGGHVDLDQQAAPVPATVASPRELITFLVWLDVGFVVCYGGVLASSTPWPGGCGASDRAGCPDWPDALCCSAPD